MKKIIVIIIILIILISIIIVLTQMPIYKHKLRPVNIKVIDSVFKKPLKNVLIYYEVELSIMKQFIGIPLINFKCGDKIISELYKTNENGELKIPGFKKYLKLYVSFR